MLTYIVAHLWLIWTSIALLCLILEITSGDFYLTCCAIGALVAIIPALAELPLWMQIVVWVVASVASVYFIRPYLVKNLHPKERQRKSNADALIGRTGRVTDAILQDGYGYVQIDGDSWRSHTTDGTPLEVGTTVTVLSRDSIILTVKSEECEV